MKANGASASRRFSARLKCTRPTRFQAGFSALQEGLQAGAGGFERARQTATLPSPPTGAQHVRRQIFRARHHRRRQHQRGEVASAGRRNVGRGAARSPSLGRRQAQRRHVARREATPPDEHRRQGLPDLAGAEPQQSLPVASGERLDTGRDGVVQARASSAACADEVALRRQAQAEMDHGISLSLAVNDCQRRRQSRPLGRCKVWPFASRC